MITSLIGGAVPREGSGRPVWPGALFWGVVLGGQRRYLEPPPSRLPAQRGSIVEDSVQAPALPLTQL